MDTQARTYLFEDLRHREQKTYPGLSFLIAMNQNLHPYSQGGAAKDIRFAELDIPRIFLTYTPLMSGLSALFRPSQDMVNFASKELAQAASKDPPYTPYLTPNLHLRPWMPETSDRLVAQAQWESYAKSSKKAQLPLELSIQSFLLYQLRFVLAADLCSAWQGFGGLGSQLSHLSTVLNLAVLETVGIAISYRNLLPLKLTEKARQRSAAEADFAHMLSAGQFDIREQAKREATTAKAPQPAKASPPEKKQPPQKIT